MERRAEKYHWYWTVMQLNDVQCTVQKVQELGQTFDDERYAAGNYYRSEARAQARVLQMREENRARQMREYQQKQYYKQRENMKREEELARHSEVSEKALEERLVEMMQNLRLLCLKYSNPNVVGYPDRLVVLPYGQVVWVELKSRGKKPRPIQEKRMADLRKRGHHVYIVDSPETLKKLRDAIVRMI